MRPCRLARRGGSDGLWDNCADNSIDNTQEVAERTNAAGSRPVVSLEHGMSTGAVFFSKIEGSSLNTLDVPVNSCVFGDAVVSQHLYTVIQNIKQDGLSQNKDMEGV